MSVALLALTEAASGWKGSSRVPGKVSFAAAGIHPLPAGKGAAAPRHLRGCNPRPCRAFA